MHRDPAYYREWKAKNPEKVKAYAKRYYEKHRKELSLKDRARATTEKRRKQRREIGARYYWRHYESIRIKNNAETKLRHADIRSKVFTAYGNKCVCCGETNPGFLTLDHVNNDGWKDRGPKGGGLDRGGRSCYRQALKENFPPRFQVLCFNCNCGRAFRGNGICPHKLVGV